MTDRRPRDSLVKNWQQSIAVRICAATLWAILPVSLLITFVANHNLEEKIRQEYVDKADLLAYRISNLTHQQMLQSSSDHLTLVDKIINELGISSLSILHKGHEHVYGDSAQDIQSVERSVDVYVSGNTTDRDKIKLVFSHPSINSLVHERRKQIIFPVIISLLTFGVFLIWVIRTIVHKPFQDLVDATVAISKGDHNIRLDSTRQDEFGFISRFFNDMLDKLMAQQEQLENVVTEAKSANKAKSVFLAHMSHELRTPLNAIIGYSEMLVDIAKDNNDLENIQDLLRIRTAGRYLLDLINNILDITRIEAGKMEVYIEHINVPKMVDDIIATLHPLAAKNSNTLIVDFPKDIGAINSDYTKLRQSIVNLLSNACKFTENGTVTLQVEQTRFRNKDKVIFKVVDTGMGIPPERLGKLFTSFSRGDAAKINDIPGTGLGLVISRFFINILGGEISVQSEVGIGTTFTIHLPREAEHISSEDLKVRFAQA